MKWIFVFLVIVFTNSVTAKSCLNDFDGAASTVSNYYNDLSKKDITLLPKYFYGETYRKLEQIEKPVDSDFEKHYSKLLFGVYSLCRTIYKVECENPNRAVVTYVGNKKGTKFIIKSSIWLHLIDDNWQIDEDRLFTTDINENEKNLAQSACKKPNNTVKRD